MEGVLSEGVLSGGGFVRAPLRRQSGYLLARILGFCLFIRVIYTILPPHGHFHNLFFINNCKCVFILCSYKFNFE